MTLARCVLIWIAVVTPLGAWQQPTIRAGLSQTPPTSADHIAQLEQDIARTPDNIQLRAEALQMYASTVGEARDDYRAARLRHIQFLIQANPASDLAAVSVSYVGAHGTPYANTNDHASVRALWQTEASQHFDDASVTLNALRFLAIEDKKEAEELFQRVLAARPSDVQTASRLGFFYAAGLVAADTLDGRVIATFTDAERAGWTDHCRAQLQNTLDPHVLMGAATALPNMAMRRTRGGPEYESLVKYSEELRHRAAAIDTGAAPKTMPAEFQLFADESKKGSEQPGAQALGVPFTPNQIKVTGNVQSANILLAPPPTYPPLAMQANVQGTVRLQVVIGQDGAVTDAQLISGHPLLVQAALDAVKTWTYRPTMVDGKAISVVTTVDVPFTLPPL